MIRKVVLSTATAFAVAVLVAAAAQAGTIQVSGIQSAQRPDGSYLMSGSLIGTWWTTSFVVKGVEPSGGVQGSGTETFVGCLDRNADAVCGSGDLNGTIDFSFTFTGKYDRSFTNEIHGRCHHPIVGGTGDFAGVGGVLDFHDDPVTGCAAYNGHLTLS